MSRSMVGLLAAVGAIVSALVGLTHGDLVPVMIASAGTASGLAAYLALPGSKKNLNIVIEPMPFLLLSRYLSVLTFGSADLGPLDLNKGNPRV
jgi:hypothetical protein